jgi:tRNA A37 methylthiotransferase MiaB
MSDAPERIWADGNAEWDSGSWGLDKEFDNDVEYVRADRIEELEAKLAEVEAERDRQYDENVHRIVKEAEAEAKLAKLAGAAKPFAAIKIKDGRSQPGEIGRTDVTNLRAALAELKEEDRG